MIFRPGFSGTGGRIGVRIPTHRVAEAVKIEKSFFGKEQVYQDAGQTAAYRTGDNPHGQGLGPQRRAVENQLRVQENGGHHKSSQPVIPHSLPGKGGGKGNRPVHAERGRDP